MRKEKVCSAKRILFIYLFKISLGSAILRPTIKIYGCKCQLLKSATHVRGVKLNENTHARTV